MRQRKTLKIEDIVSDANVHLIMNSTNDKARSRYDAVEGLLMNLNAYDGFGYYKSVEEIREQLQNDSRVNLYDSKSIDVMIYRWEKLKERCTRSFCVSKGIFEIDMNQPEYQSEFHAHWSKELNKNNFVYLC